MSFVKGLIKVNLAALLFIAGYSYCKYVNTDSRYTIKRAENVVYLVDKELNQMREIDEVDFELGDLRRKLEQLLEETKFSGGKL